MLKSLRKEKKDGKNMLVFATEKSVPREYELFCISKWSLLPFYH